MYDLCRLFNELRIFLANVHNDKGMDSDYDVAIHHRYM